MIKLRDTIKTEFKKLLTKEVLTYLIGVPFLAVLAFGLLYSKRIGREYPLIVVDLEKNAMSRLVVQYLDSSPELKVTQVMSSLEEASKEVRAERALAIVYINRGLYKNVLKKTSQPAIVIVDCRNIVSANSVLMGIAKTLGTVRVGAELKLMNKYFPVSDRMEKILPLRVVSRSLGNPSVDYFLFVISAVLILAIQQGLLVGTSFGIAKEREFGTFNSTLVTCGGAWSYFFSRGLAIFVFAVPTVLLLCLMFHVVFAVPTENILLSILLLLLFSMTVIAFGNVIGPFFRHRLMVLQVLFFFTLPVFFVSGYTFPLESIHPVMRFISSLLPATPILNAFPRINYIEGAAPYVGGFFLHQAGLFLLYSLLSFLNIPTRLKNRKNKKQN